MVDEQVQRNSMAPLTLDAEGRLTIALSEEFVHVGKTQVDRGGIRITKRVEATEQQIDETLLYEDVEVERRAVGRDVDRIPDVRREGDTLIYPIVEERLYTEKRLVLVEELHVTRLQRTEPYSKSIALRKEHITIERLEPESKSDPGPT